jgi:hypothetical protein
MNEQQLYNSERLGCEACSSSLCDTMYKHISNQLFFLWLNFYILAQPKQISSEQNIRCWHLCFDLEKMILYCWKTTSVGSFTQVSVRPTWKLVFACFLKEQTQIISMRYLYVFMWSILISLYKNALYVHHPQDMCVWLRHLEHEGDYSFPSRGKNKNKCSYIFMSFNGLHIIMLRLYFITTKTAEQNEMICKCVLVVAYNEQMALWYNCVDASPDIIWASKQLFMKLGRR